MAWALVVAVFLFFLFWVVGRYFDKSSGNRIHPKISDMMSTWVALCRIYFDDNALSIPRVRLGFKLFVIGSVDYLCNCLQLSDITSKKTVFLILRKIDCSREEALFLIDNYDYIMITDFGHDAIFAGGKNMLEWVTGENKRKVAGEQQSLIDGRKQVCSALLSLIEEWSKTPEIPEELFLIKNQYEGKKHDHELFSAMQKERI